MRPWPTTMFAGRKSSSSPVVVVGPLAGERADLVEAVGVEEAVDPLAHGEAAGRALARDALGAAHPLGELLAPPKLVELGLPSLLVSGLLHAAKRYR